MLRSLKNTVLLADCYYGNGCDGCCHGRGTVTARAIFVSCVLSFSHDSCPSYALPVSLFFLHITIIVVSNVVFLFARFQFSVLRWIVHCLAGGFAGFSESGSRRPAVHDVSFGLHRTSVAV